jgi:heat shock protein HtpX
MRAATARDAPAGIVGGIAARPVHERGMRTMNNIKVFMLMAGLTALFVALGGYLGGQGGMIMALLLTGGMNFFMYFASDRMVLRMYGARIVSVAEAPELYGMVDRLRQRAGLPMPTVAIAPQDQPNAFATGRNPEHAVVCVTEGILRLISKEELEGVIAHELAHIKNRDMLLQTVTATMAGAISSLAWIGMFAGGRGDDEEGGNPVSSILMVILAPLAASLVQMAISRQREYKADAVGAEICGRPLALASALRKLELGARRIPMHVSPAAAPLAQVNPLAFSGGGMAKLFSTHPPTEERVARLQALASRP